MMSIRRILSRLSSDSDVSTVNPVASFPDLSALSVAEREAKRDTIVRKRTKIDKKLDSVCLTQQLVEKEQKTAAPTDSVWLRHLESASIVCQSLIRDLLHERELVQMDLDKLEESLPVLVSFEADTESALEF